METSQQQILTFEDEESKEYVVKLMETNKEMNAEIEKISLVAGGSLFIIGFILMSVLCTALLNRYGGMHITWEIAFMLDTICMCTTFGLYSLYLHRKERKNHG